MKKFKQFFNKEKEAEKEFNNLLYRFTSKNTTVVLDIFNADVMYFDNTAFADFLEQVKMWKQDDYLDLKIDNEILEYLDSGRFSLIENIKTLEQALLRCKKITTLDVNNLNKPKDIFTLIERKSSPLKI